MISAITKKLRPVLFLLVFLPFQTLIASAQCDTSLWKALIDPGGGGAITDILDAQTVFQNGILTASPSASYPSPYYVNFIFKDTICITNNFAIEVRLKNDVADGGAPSGDTWINLNGSGIIAGCLLEGDPIAQQYTSIYVGGNAASNLPQLVMNLSSWRTIRMDFIDNVVYFSYDGANFFSMPYSGSICNINNLDIGFREAGEVDYVKVFDAYNSPVYYEEFTDCNNITPAPNCLPPDVTASSANVEYCQGDSIQLTGSSNVAVQYTWSGPNSFSSTLQNPVIYNSLPGNQGWYVLHGYINPCSPTNDDSVYITIHPKKITILNPAICQGDAYLAGGANQTSAGTYYDTLATTFGCDSVIITNLSVLQTSATSLTAAICQGDSLFVGGSFQNVAGIYHDTLQNSLGCDSVISTTLSVIAPVYHNQNLYICQSDSIFLGGTYQKFAGVYNDTTNSAAGCDSVIITSLSVIAPVYTNLNVTICQGTSYFVGGASQSLAGTYYDTLNTVLGCDSVLITQLQVTPPIHSYQTISICLGDSFYVGGTYQMLAGSYTDTVQTLSGCDSIVTTDLQLIYPVYGNRTISICQGDSFFVGGSFQSLAGSYIDTIQSVAGCDSILTTDLQLIPPVFTNVTINICDGDSFYVGGNYQVQAGLYNDTLNTSAGCDSIIITNLQLIAPVYSSVGVNLCQGDSFFVGGGYQSQAGIYNDTLQSNAGCDSIVTTTLQLIVPVYSNVNAAICNGDQYFAGGAFQTMAGTYYDTLQSAAGCDSVVITQLQIIFPVYGSFSVSICDGQSYFVGGGQQTMTGVYYDTLQAATACDSIVITDLTVLPNPIVYLGQDTSICEGTVIQLNAGTGFSSYTWNNSSHASSIEANDAGDYWVQVTDQNGCTASDTIQILQVLKNPSGFLPADSAVCGKFLRLIEVPGFVAYLWSNGSDNSFLTITDPGIYSLQVTDANGCTGNDEIVFESVCDEPVLMPNAFTPNGDGLNDVFKPVLLDNITDYELKIFNRWGKLIFDSTNPAVGWDGKEKNILLGIEQYVWTVRYTNDAGEDKFMKGSVALLR